MTVTEDYDVVVVGGGAGGFGAAVGAAQAGARTLLLESAGFLGGAATLKCVQTYCGLFTISDEPRPAVLGASAQSIAELRELGGVRGPVKFRGTFMLLDSEAVKFALDQVCADAGVEVILHAMVVRAQRDGGRVQSITYHDHNGDHEVRGAAFVDATGECDLAFFAGASTRYGNHGVVNLGTLGTRFGGIAPEADVSAGTVTDVIKKAKARGVRRISKDKSMIARLPLSGDVVAYLVSEDYDPRDVRSLSRAEISGRAQAWTYLEILRELPGWEHAYLASTGPEFGTRESRHINSVEQLTWHHVTEGRRTEDCVALGSWGVEWHDRETFERSFVYKPDGGTYDIPLGCLRSVDTSNLFAAGRTADGDRQAGASLRVMGTAFATGQAAGVAAACHARRGRLEAAEVRKVLASQGALLDPADMPAPVNVI